jgi:hypothetical protein
MSRPKAPIPTPVNFHARLTAGEGRAVDAMIARHGEELAKLGATGGGNAAAWFRATVRRLAAEQGIAIVEDAAPTTTSAPASKARKRARK